MSSAYFVVLENPDPGFKTYVNGAAVAKAAPNLDRIARMLHVRRIEDFVSQDLAEYFDDDEEDDFHGNVAEPHTVWYDASEGLEWATKIAEYIRANPDDVHDAESVLFDLDEYAELFRNAAKAKIRFHIEVDF
ncbi:MAG: hypothetical protein KJO55_01480 [Gammaproteobacteria bacterium]|nr:hypothetical protein [Gammaproteobacteria bacterium]NND60374.1 hypothetical protein [Gammaproteobacteria bacterium]